nr:peptidylprolyl isomerase [uncultured Sphaerochaeta sp.]
MKIGSGTTVFLEYDLFNKDRELLESTSGDGKIAYIHGEGMMLDALEKELEGQEAGDEFSVELSMDEAFGPRNEQLVVTLPRSEFAELGEIAVGDEFQTHDTNGEPILVAITELSDDEVTVDGNHPYSGMDVTFEIKVIEVRETTDEDRESFSAEHHHDHECGCGHDHGADDGCGCGHDHGEDHECCGGHSHGEDHECCGGSGSGCCG